MEAIKGVLGGRVSWSNVLDLCIDLFKVINWQFLYAKTCTEYEGEGGRYRDM